LWQQENIQQTTWSRPSPHQPLHRASYVVSRLVSIPGVRGYLVWHLSQVLTFFFCSISVSNFSFFLVQ
jgi:hypothetical protein